VWLQNGCLKPKDYVLHGCLHQSRTSPSRRKDQCEAAKGPAVTKMLSALQ
jgi:hypothetical protein